MKHITQLFILTTIIIFCCNGNLSGTSPSSTYCNPLNLDYGWGNFRNSIRNARTSADPVIVLFKGKYYLFTTQDIGGYRVSDDLIHWQNIYFDPAIHTSALDIDHYVAPAAAADDHYLYFINFNRNRDLKEVDLIRSSDPMSGKWEVCGKVRRMADPSLFIDKGRYFVYYGLGANQQTTCYELDSVTLTEIPGSAKLLREYITDVNDCEAGYHFGRRELSDELDASAWKGKFKNLPCPEGAWIIKHNNKYYLQYATPGTIHPWYCDIVTESDSPTGPFEEKPYNPVSLKVGGFIGGAGHSSVFQDKFQNWWQATTMWIGNHDEFERRIGLFPVSFDKQGRMRTHTVLGDYPLPLPQHRFTPSDVNIVGWMVQSYQKKCTASSELLGFETYKASDENVRTWWSATTGNPGEWLIMDFGKKVRVNAIQVNFAEQDVDYGTSLNTDYHAYKLYVSTDGKKWKMVADKSLNKTPVPHDYIELARPMNISYVKIENVHTPRNGKFALLDLRVFGFGKSKAPAQVEKMSVERDRDDERYASLSWNKVNNADGYLIRFGYAPDFLNQCIQVKGNETTSLLLHILIKGTPYYYRVDTYNDSGITQGDIISDIKS